MAVFTPVSDADASALLAEYSLGELVSLRGITAGIENTNYFLNTTRGEFVLTLFEKLDFTQLPFYIELMAHLAGHGVPVPSPQLRRDGSRIGALHGKPSAIVTRLAGGYEPAPGPAHCSVAARTQAAAHLAARDFTLEQANLRGLAWWRETIPQVLPFLSAEQGALVQDELAAQEAFAASADYAALVRGPVHCDLFRDNVLFAGTSETPIMGGIIDFYFAGCDTWLFDVAVAANDWCIVRETGAFVPELLHAWLDAYHAARPFSDAERRAWPMMLRAAALRFWVSRLYDFHLPRSAQTLKPHDPGHFERILRLRRAAAGPALPGVAEA
ncbi:homoserine kinase [Verticiella sediminum]|uniref:Homoserine kinase n=1 Tax=Verticiella sediminum TaxID=1247510 RepID=A0A556ABL2_9BURK|nr:homoserine kinase [Verticiella sediminum]TSH90284.1 homoserine kinase [Verticiella sediminum]